MNFDKRFLFVGLVLLPVTGCMDQILQPRAQRDLACSDVQVTATYAGEYEASGCGQTVDYACVPGRYGSTCIREGNIDAPVIVQAAPPTPTAPTSSEPGFPLAAAVSSMKLAANYAADCNAVTGPRGTGSADVTFAADGSVSSVVLSEPFEGTPVGECVADKFRRVTIPAFANGPKSTKKSFEVPDAAQAKVSG